MLISLIIVQLNLSDKVDLLHCNRTDETKETLENVSHLSSMCPIGTSSITFKTSNITSIPNLFEYYQDIGKLFVRNSGIVKINSGTFAMAHQLDHFDAAENNLPVIYNGMFFGANHLTILTLTSSKISNIESKAFLSLGALIKLEINSNNLISLPQDVFDPLIKLQVLDMSKNQLTTLGHRLFLHAKQVRNVFLNLNRLEWLQDNTFEDTQLEWLDLSHNSALGEINLTENSTRYLALLTVTNTSLKSLDIAPSMHQVNANINSITTIRLLGSATSSSLRRLNLAENHITSFSNFRNFPDLVILDLNDNNISVLDYDELHYMSKLRQLSVVRNPITEIINVSALVMSLPFLADIQLTQHRWTNEYIHQLDKELRNVNIVLVVDNSLQATTLPPHLKLLDEDVDDDSVVLTEPIELSNDMSKLLVRPTLPPSATTATPSASSLPSSWDVHESPNINFDDIMRILKDIRKSYAHMESKISTVMNTTLTTSGLIAKVEMRNETLNTTVENIILYLWVAFSSFGICLTGLLVYHFKVYQIMYVAIRTCCTSCVVCARGVRQEHSHVNLMHLNHEDGAQVMPVENPLIFDDVSRPLNDDASPDNTDAEDNIN